MPSDYPLNVPSSSSSPKIQDRVWDEFDKQPDSNRHVSLEGEVCRNANMTNQIRCTDGKYTREAKHFLHFHTHHRHSNNDDETLYEMLFPLLHKLHQMEAPGGCFRGWIILSDFAMLGALFASFFFSFFLHVCHTHPTPLHSPIKPLLEANNHRISKITPWQMGALRDNGPVVEKSRKISMHIPQQPQIKCVREFSGGKFLQIYPTIYLYNCMCYREVILAVRKIMQNLENLIFTHNIHQEIVFE